MPRRFFPVLVLACVFTLAAGSARAEIISVNPRATYFRTNSDASPNAVAIDLASRGFLPGDFVELSVMGDYKSIPSGNDDVVRPLGAVFSSSATLLSSSNLNRVVGAIDAGTDFLSVPTFIGTLPTDISQDFLVPHADLEPGLTIQVPTSATHLFVSVHDSFYSDNSDPNGNFAISVTAAVPEPSSWALLSAAGIGFAVVRRRKSNAKLRTSGFPA